MRNRMNKLALLLVLLAPLANERIARADTKEEARRHFDRAVELVDDGQLEGALVEFQRSYDLTRHFAVLYNIGQVLVSLARPVEAVDAYQRYLAEGRDLVPAARRAEVEKEMLRQKARIATIDIRGLPDGAMVRVDGKEIGRAPFGGSLRVGVGKHSIAAAAEGYDPAATEVTVAGEDYKVVNLPLARSALPATLPLPVAPPAFVAPAAPVVVAMPLAEPAKPSMSKLRVAGIVTAAVGVAGLAAGTAFWFTAKGRQDDALNVYKDDYPKAQNLHSEAANFVTAANVSFIAGGALVALGVVGIILGSPDRGAATSGMHAYVLPAVGPGSAGLGAGGTW
jgi:hypothetical protein